LNTPYHSQGIAMDNRFRPYFAELLGTFVLVFVGAGTVCAGYLTTEPRLGVTAMALAEGFALAVALTAAYHVSTCCFNPAITLMHWVFKRLDGRRTVGLIAVQLLGATLAGLAVRVTFVEPVLRESRLGTPHLEAFRNNDKVEMGSLISGVGVEAFFTFLVTLAVFATLIDRRGPRLGGVLVGLAQAAVVLFGFRLTGGAANPARWFGPALWQLTVPELATQHPLADHAVYWAGPIVGALLGGFVYSAVFLPSEARTGS
jgi:aquaporin Z